jgi:hypothetical protein
MSITPLESTKTSWRTATLVKGHAPIFFQTVMLSSIPALIKCIGQLQVANITTEGKQDKSEFLFK